MKIPEQDQKKIEEIIVNYLMRKGIMPTESVIMSFVIKPKIEVESNVIPISLLQENFETLWAEYAGSISKANHTRIRHVMINLRVVTMFDLVTKNEFQLVAARNGGKRTVTYLKDWLDSFGLHLGMSFSKEVRDDFIPPLVSITKNIVLPGGKGIIAGIVDGSLPV